MLSCHWRCSDNEHVFVAKINGWRHQNYKIYIFNNFQYIYVYIRSIIIINNTSDNNFMEYNYVKIDSMQSNLMLKPNMCDVKLFN